MSAESDLVLAVTKRLRDAKGEHPESVHVKEELARLTLEAQRMYREERVAKEGALARLVQYEGICIP